MKFITIFSTAFPTPSTEWSVLPDSVGLISDRPLFVRDEIKPVIIPMIAVRISRLGKGIEPRFANRYWEEAAPAFQLLPGRGAELLNEGVVPPVSMLCFDNAIVTGELRHKEEIRFRFNNSEKIFSIDPKIIDRYISLISETNTIKTGDFVLLAVDGPFSVRENDIITAIFETDQPQNSTSGSDHKALRTKIK